MSSASVSTCGVRLYVSCLYPMGCGSTCNSDHLVVIPCENKSNLVARSIGSVTALGSSLSFRRPYFLERAKQASRRFVPFVTLAVTHSRCGAAAAKPLQPSVSERHKYSMAIHF